MFAPLNFVCCKTLFTRTIESVISAIESRGWNCPLYRYDAGKRKLVAGWWHLSLINRSNSAKRTVIRTRSKGKPLPLLFFPRFPLPHFIHLLVIFPLEIPDWRSLSKTITKKDDRYWTNGRETVEENKESVVYRDLFRHVNIVVSYEFYKKLPKSLKKKKDSRDFPPFSSRCQLSMSIHSSYINEFLCRNI